jgi:hypothetical protein
MNTAQTYLELEKKSTMEAYEKAASDILFEKKKLRQKDPKNPLLNLVLVSCDFDFMNAKNFKSILYEHLPTEALDRKLSALEEYGFYVDMLREEQVNPKFLKR